jgi:retron-type reverse transcriptase
MNANKACASSAATAHWDQIDWSRCEQQVVRLQARIVKASRERRWGKVKVLQRLLTYSFSGKALAVKRVTENKGKRTSGADQVLWSTPQSKLKAIASLQRRDDEGQSHAGAISNVSGTNRRNVRGPQLLWLPKGPLYRRCHRTVL